MKLSKEELKTKISNFGIDEDVKIELLEDVEDSFDDSSNDAELSALQQKYDDLREKYKSRFLSKDEKEENEEKEDEDLKEETVIDITEI